MNELFGSVGSTCRVKRGDNPGCEVEERRVRRGG